MKFTAERKKVFTSICLNFFAGAIFGIILFYSQMKKNGIGEALIEINKTVTLIDLLRLIWLDLLWFFSLFIARLIAPLKIAHPIMAARGCICTFSVSCILIECGIKETAVVVIPQCLSLFPLMTIFSVMLLDKRKRAIELHTDPNSLRRSDAFIIFLLSAVAAALELLLYRLFLLCLF